MVTPFSGSTTGQSRFGKRPPAPGKLTRIPAVEARHGNAIPGGMDEPAVADVDPHVPDLGRLRFRAFAAEEDDVGRLELRERDAPRLRHLAAHLVRRPAAESRGKGALVRVGLELVHAPDESRAVIAAARGDAELRLRAVARAAPDVGHPDAGNGGR